jgi:hypothetical protein
MDRELKELLRIFTTKENEMMFKIYIATVILAIMFCFSVGTSTFTYVGPYEVSFNSTTHPVYLISVGPSYGWFKNKDDQWDTTSTYVGISGLNNSTTQIDITEGALTNTVINNLTSLAPNEGFVKLQQLDRTIDGHDATFAKYRNIGGWISQLAIIVFPVQFKYYDYSSGNTAVIRISGSNYTDYEFDRLLDTFKINRLVSR